MKKLFFPFLIFFAGCFWGLSAIFVRGLESQGFLNSEITFLRFLISTIIICLIYSVTNQKSFAIKPINLWTVVGSGVLGIFLTSLTYFSTISNASSSVACILMYTAPIFVTIISRFVFKEKFTTLKIVCLSLAFIGTVLCSYDKNVGKVELPVFLVGLASGLAYASYSIFSKLAINKNVSAETILIYSFVFGMVASCFTVDFNHLFSIITKNNFNLINAVLLSVLSTVLPYTFYTLGLKKVESSKASIIACIEIVCATLVGLVAFNEFPSYFAIIGLVMVIGAIVLLNVFNITNKESNNDQT